MGFAVAMVSCFYKNDLVGDGCKLRAASCKSFVADIYSGGELLPAKPV
jgi:hypothetical protein